MNDKFKPSNGRKKLSLCTPRKNQTPTTEKAPYSKPQTKANTQSSNTSDDEKLNWLYTQKESLAKQILQVERRLVFGFSEPLKAYAYELKRKDMLLSCKISEILIAKLNT